MLAELLAIVTLVRVWVPPLPYRLSFHIPPPLVPEELPEIVVLVKANGPPFLTPPPSLPAELPEIVELVTVKRKFPPYLLSLRTPPP